VATKQSDAESRIKHIISVGAAYQRTRDMREVLASMFAIGLVVAGVVIGAYATITGRIGEQSIALVALALFGAFAGALIPWVKIAREWLLSLYWLSLLVLAGAIYAFDVPALSLLLLLPMMALTCFFWERPKLMAGNLIAAAVAFSLPVFTGDAPDAASSLIITLPALIAVAILAGGLAARFNTMRVAERNRYKATIEALSTALTARDGYTGEHSEETLGLVAEICKELRLAPDACEYIADVALLHDIGKIGIPNEILHEPGKLNDEQWDIMREHPVIGERIVVTIPGLEEVARAIRHEHERWDGGGYPDGLVAGEIPLASRIVLVCDAFHAMTSDRPYRMAMSVDEARLELSKNAGSQFDPTVVGALLNVLDGRTRDIDSGRRGGFALSGYRDDVRMMQAAV
jgi:HD-GYP domain-containing protein (c-di-GMP phosphodiesterase class II)